MPRSGDVALDVVIHPRHLDAARGPVSDVPDGKAESERLQ